MRRREQIAHLVEGMKTTSRRALQTGADILGDFMKDPEQTAINGFGKVIGVLIGLSAIASLFALINGTFNRFTFDQHVLGKNNTESKKTTTCSVDNPEIDLIQILAHTAAVKTKLYDKSYRVGSIAGDLMGNEFGKIVLLRARDSLPNVNWLLARHGSEIDAARGETPRPARPRSTSPHND